MKKFIEIEEPNAQAVATCGDCDWKGPADELTEPEGAILTPGDPVPAGRCPECAALAYVGPPYKDMIRTIHAILDEEGEEWDSETMSRVAEVFTENGYVIRDPNEVEDDHA